MMFSAGGDSSIGSTRNLLTEQREIMPGHLLDKVLNDHANQNIRPVCLELARTRQVIITLGPGTSLR